MSNVSAARKLSRFNNIQILRFLAATSVLIFHAGGTGLHYFPGQDSAFFYLFQHADNGVDLFFVISGFIICYTNSGSDMHPGNFLQRRIERILPVYWIYTILIFLLSKEIPQIFKNGPWVSVEYLMKSLLFVSFSDDRMPIIYVGWSLEYEIFFYISVALFALISRNPMKYILLVFPILVAVGTIPAISQSIGVGNFFVRSLLMEFVFGVLAAKFFRGDLEHKETLLAVAGSTLLLIYTAPEDRAVLVGIPSAMVVFLAARLNRNRRALSWPEGLLGRLGDASYSIYLVQVFTISGFCKIFLKLWPSMPLSFLIMIVVIATILVGWVAYMLLERPISRVFRTVGLRTRLARA